MDIALMVHFQVTLGAGVPVYRQLMEQVKYHVASGTLKPGDALPSIRELAGRLAVNPSTVVKAFGELEHEGVVELIQGKGAFVLNHGRKLSTAEMKKALRDGARRLAVEARQMGLPRRAVIEILEEELEKLDERAGKI